MCDLLNRIKSPHRKFFINNKDCVLLYLKGLSKFVCLIKEIDTFLLTTRHAGNMKTYWLLDCRGRASCKGEFKIPEIRSEATLPFDRKSSIASRRYSPVTQNDVAQRSLASTPIPSATGQSDTSDKRHELSLSNSLDRTQHPNSLQRLSSSGTTYSEKSGGEVRSAFKNYPKAWLYFAGSNNFLLHI